MHSTECDLNVTVWTTNLEDLIMLGKLAKGDLFTQDVVYHKECMTKYYKVISVKSVVKVRLVSLSWRYCPC